MFDKVLIANRGEVALRIWRACKSLGLQTVAVYSEADRDLRHVKLADSSICIGPAPASKSYLLQERILLAAQLTGAQAIHPGYGFLSENAHFVKAIEEADLTFIGPSSAAIACMGDKVSAKQAMIAAGVPCVPGSEGAVPESESEILECARKVGYPLIIKAAGGGGGRGMRVVNAESELLGAVTLTREEANAAFGNPVVYMERFLQAPRHVEIQILADQHGNAIWLGERDCSTQRRHQKLIEESPAPGVSRDSIERIGQLCVKACLAIGYVGAGTFEFLYENEAFFFIEMNTRVQVEHPVTEMVTGVDIVAEQLRVAMGLPLSITQDKISLSGHAIECRINAENAWTFSPSAGTVSDWLPPGGPGIRIESHLRPGYRMTSHYDSLIAKVIAHGATRQQAIERMKVALSELIIAGFDSNIPLHQEILKTPQFVQGGANIHYLEHYLSEREGNQMS
ncbi:acetyl-CoA carboxylase biotin carboxylase subunit [Pseudomonas sp. 7P_10.2_Bac1]|uniref:acetyl-CoA carboxylase biotin carboxylase subunit n=1 Tax=Pseudomonas sp. 7P_10.2_Bac1 TaxID=2971614 RepID=UPI0021C8A8A9|nr:acetyl-CoA carboxylase biotin carboxylase subunit [Pseudomonas sp. 7P_10.2_Bac1]MCU1728595.1 acetyl-CoA carboxylase biotin carboxylase subunit [Pseudomonas sp. 7P_10.2_Bac1]